MRYLDPKADLTFKRVFGEHPDLIISFLNALLPLNGPDEEITDVEYLPAELVPDNPMKKHSIVDVRCKDRRGRQFIVEMQMIWSPEFKQRVMFNASKAYVRQLDKGEHYELLQPVYSLNLVNDIFEPGLETYYQHYRMVMLEHTDYVIEGLEIVFIELPKFKASKFSEKRMQVLWLRFLTEIDEKTRSVPQELLDSPEIKKAVDQIEESAFTDAQLLGYDKFWDMVSVEKTLFVNAERKFKKGYAEGMEKGMAEGMEKGMAEGMEKGMAEGMEKGRAEGIAQGIEQGIERGKAEEKIKTARCLKQLGVSWEKIKAATGLTEEEISQA